MTIKRALLLISVISIITAAWGAYVYMTLPDINKLNQCIQSKMNKVELCPTSASYVKLADVSSVAVESFVLSEDAAFFQHEGFDWHELKTSFWTNLTRGRFARGGSTITQQLAKNVYTSGEKTLSRKLREAILASRIEKTFHKDLILEKYLNVVELGADLYGVKAASRYYFDKAPSKLGLLESVYLAHLLPNPKVYSQGFAKEELTEFSVKMITLLLKRMHRFGRITEDDLEDALDDIDEFPWKHRSLFQEMYDVVNDTVQDAVNDIFSAGSGEEDPATEETSEDQPEQTSESEI